MTSKENEHDWIDEHFEDKCSIYQMGRIEQLMVTSSAAENYEHLDIEQLTYEEAKQIIEVLEDNDNPRDCREQFRKILKRNNFYS
jgi:hypothetical protein|tara:strand:- start:23 stop:277 length:255 start_codon:yes stop_codon:yes gene_type:complete